MNKVLPWIKSNLAIVILAVVMVVALVLGPIFSSRWNASVKKEAQARADQNGRLEKLGKTPVTLTIPGQGAIQKTTTVNPHLLREYERLTNELRQDAVKVRELAVDHNRKGR